MPTDTNPFERFEELAARMSRQFDEAARSWESGGRIAPWLSETGSMAVDLAERDDAFVVTVDAPGFTSDEIDVRVANSALRIHAEHAEATAEEADYVHKERSHRSLHRTIRLPAGADPDAVSATLRNGVLTITIAKIEPAEGARSIEIESE